MVRCESGPRTGRWRTSGEMPEATPPVIRAHARAKRADSPAETARLVEADGLPWEAVNAEHLSSPDVWNALLPSMGIGALVRNLARMTANGTLVAGNAAVDVVVGRLADGDELRRARLHPIALLSALLTYRAGRGARGQLTWDPVTRVVDALDAAFYQSFGLVEPAGTRQLLALDVSGSVATGTIA